MRQVKFQCIVMGLVILVGCQRNYLTKDELKNYPMNPDNGIFMTSTKGNVQFETYYKPKDLIIAQMAGDIETEFFNIKNEYDSLDYFIVRMSRNGEEIESSYAANPDQFTQAVNYLSGSLGQKFYLIHQQDTIHPLDVLYVRMFGATKATQVMPVFKSNLLNCTGKVRLCFEDDFFGTAHNEFEFEIKNIKKIPKLNFHNL
jgi:hypothetical protein